MSLDRTLTANETDGFNADEDETALAVMALAASDRRISERCHFVN